MAQAKRKTDLRALKPRKRKTTAVHVEPKDVPPSARPALRRARVKVRPIDIQPKTTRDAMAEVVAILTSATRGGASNA